MNLVFYKMFRHISTQRLPDFSTQSVSLTISCEWDKDNYMFTAHAQIVKAVTFSVQTFRHGELYQVACTQLDLLTPTPWLALTEANTATFSSRLLSTTHAQNGIVKFKMIMRFCCNISLISSTLAKFLKTYSANISVENQPSVYVYFTNNYCLRGKMFCGNFSKFYLNLPRFQRDDRVIQRKFKKKFIINENKRWFFKNYFKFWDRQGLKITNNLDKFR